MINWKEKLGSTNFLMAVMLFIGGLWVGFPQEDAKQVLLQLLGVFAGIGSLRTFFKNAKLDPIEWVKNSNTWMFLSVILTTFFPKLTPELFQAVRAIVEQAIGGNWQGIFTAVISLATIIWNIFKSGQLKKLAVMLVLTMAVQSAQAQVFDSYKRDVRKAEKKYAKQAQEFPIVLDPIEQVPERSTKRFTAAGPDNWGQRLVLPDTIKARLQAECKYPGQVEIFDTGGKWDHTFLQQGQLPGSSYTGETLLDGNGHSTHCAGIIGADQFGVLDALIDNGICRFKPVKVLSNAGSGSFDWVTNAVRTEDVTHKQVIAGGGFVVVSGSFGGGTALYANLETALKASTDLGVLYVFAAGNSGGPVNYPGNSKYAITCASLDEGGGVSSYSSRGPEVSNAMPGRAINSTYKGNTFAVLSGTSMATPFLASAAFIAKSKWGPKIKNYTDMRQYLARVSRDIPPDGRDDPSGYGLVLIKAILDTDPSSAEGPTDPVDPPQPPTGPPTRAEKTITVAVAGRYPMYWNIQGTASTDVPKLMRVTKKNLATAGLSIVYVTRLEVDLSTKYFTPVAQTQLAEGVKWFFTNRGLVLGPDSDYRDAAIWSAYFADMILLKDKQLAFTVRSIQAEDELGNAVIVPSDQVPAWPIKQKGL